MEQYILVVIITAVIAGGLGVFVGRILLKKFNKKSEREAREKAKMILKEAEINAESIKKDRILEAKEKYFKLKTEYEEELNKKKNIIITNENKLKQREQVISKQMEQVKRQEAELESMKENLSAQLHSLQVKKDELDKVTKLKIAELEKISNLTADEARDQLVETLKDEAQTKASSHIKDILDEAKLTATKQAKKVVLDTIQRTATEHAIENCVSVFNIESDISKVK